MLRANNISVEEIATLLAILVIPWTFKFLWAPLVDSLRSEKWNFKAWIISAQLFMGFSLIPLIFIKPSDDFFIWQILLIIHAFSAATQDVSIDALVINSISEKERGEINGWMQAGMLLGRGLFGGGTLLIISIIGWREMIIIIISSIWLILLVLIFVKEPDEIKKSKANFNLFYQHLSGIFKNKTTWFGLLFALTAGAAFESTGALAGPFLIDRNISQQTVGLFFGVFVIVSMMTGSIIGGKYSDKIGRIKSVIIFLLGFSLTIILLGIFDIFSAGSLWLIIILIILYLFIGLFTASSYAMFMDITDPKLGATQFSTYMAATNGCESWSAFVGGKIVTGWGYSYSFFIMSFISILSLIFLRFISINKNKLNK